MDRHAGRFYRLTGAEIRRKSSSWPPQHEVEAIGADLRNGQYGYRCAHCRQWRSELFTGACPERIRQVRAAMKRRKAGSGT